MTQIKLKRATAQRWIDVYPIVLGDGEPGLETDTKRIKFGDGETEWQNLGYLAASTDRLVGGANQLVLNSDGTLTFPNGSMNIYATIVGTRNPFTTNGDGTQVVNTNSLTIEILDIDLAAALVNNPTNYTIIFNDDSVASIEGITGPEPSTSIYTITGTWDAATLFPIIVQTNDYATNFTELDSDSGMALITSQGRWTFGADGNLTLPVEGDILNSDGISVLNKDVLGKFVFDSDGDSAFIQTTDDAGASPDRYDIVLVPGGEGNSFIRVPNQANSLAGNPLIIGATATNGAVKIETELGNWTFGTDGIGPATSISLNPGPAVGYTTATNVPTNTNIGTGSGLTVDIVANGISISSVIINQPGQGYAVGDQLQIDQISSTGTGEITVEAIQGTSPVITLPYGHTIGSGSMDGIKLTTDRGTILLGNSPECVPTALTHFHVMKDDPSAVDLFFGDDNNYVKLPGSQETAYGVEIGTNDGSAQLWRFGTDGTTTFPRNTVDSGANEIALKSHKYSELHWQSDQLVTQVNAPSDNFVGVDDQGAYISTVGTEYANTWAFGNNGTLRFPDGTIQTTAYDSIPLDNIGLDGGSASVIYEVSRLFADGGSAGNRFGPNDPIFDGTGAGVVYGPSDLVLNGGVA